MPETRVVYANVNNVYSLEIKSGDTERIEILQLDQSTRFRHGNKNHMVQIRNQSRNHRSCTIRIDGYDFEVKLSMPLDRLIEELGFDTRKNNNSKEVRAPMPGQVIAIFKKNGDAVLAETPLITLEAMKMENIVQTPLEGTIDTIYVKLGETVKKGQLIAKMD